MILTIAEIEWVKERMKIYVIKYQEIYDEVLDHILTAIEERRKAGDGQDIESLFQNVVDEHFSGYAGIESLASTEEHLYRKRLSKLFYTNLKQQFNWKALIFTAVLLFGAYQLPNITFINKMFVMVIFLLSISPVLIAFISLYGKIATIKGKKSLLKRYLIAQTLVPMMLFNSFIYCPVLIGIITGQDDNFKPIKHLPPVVMMAFLVLFMIVNISYVQSSRQLITKKFNR
jgi:hypothetical protein